MGADGGYFDIRLDEARQCLLVLMGVTPDGRKAFLAIEDGYRESEQSWTELLQGLKQRGLMIAPELAIGDGALGFWKAVRKLSPKTRTQRCWVHKTVNILNKLPKALQPKAKRDLHQIWLAETREAAETAFAAFVTQYGAKYEKAVEGLAKDRETLLPFDDFPAEHWAPIRTTTPIESPAPPVGCGRPRRGVVCPGKPPLLSCLNSVAVPKRAGGSCVGLTAWNR